MNALDLDTPAVYVDLDVLERNLRAMQERCRGWGVGLRPHTKTHKIPEIARMQLAFGAIGVTVAKIGEAEVMPGDDVLIAYPVVPEKVPRLRALARERRVTVVTDCLESARALDGLRTLVEVDIGFGRCGVQSPEQYEVVASACRDFQGLFYYPGPLAEEGMRQGAKIVRDCLQRRRGGVVSGGSTPNAGRTPLIPETTEVRFGTYALHDASAVAIGVARPEDCAVRVLTTVVSTAVPGQCVIDGGSKTFSSNPTKEVGGFGLFPDKPWRFERMNEEHGYVKVTSPARVGEKVWVVPAHVGTCINLHDEVWYGRDGRVEGRWPVAARGRVR